MRRIRIFVASPSDVSEEREAASLVIDELRRVVTGYFDVDLEAVRWETHAFPDVGADAQDVINSEIGEYDIFVGVMWKRFGTPTKRAASGTAEEFERAFDSFVEHGAPKIMFYFRTAPFYSTDTKEIRQFQKVLGFRSKLQKAGVLFWEYSNPLEFERSVREHLLRQFFEQRITRSASKKKPFEVAASGTGIKGKKEDFSHRRNLPIFISYSHADTSSVSKVATTLRTGGFPVWIDSDQLLPGERWLERVRSSLEESRIALLFVSQAAVERGGSFYIEMHHVISDYMKKASSDFSVIVVRLDHMPPPPAFKDCLSVNLFENDGLRNLIENLDYLASHRQER